MLRLTFIVLTVVSSSILLAGTAPPEGDEKLITILSTNDIHGGLEPSFEFGVPGKIGGMAMLSGSVKAIRESLTKGAYKGKSGVVLVDAGDQFQGTILSNYNEGKLVFKIMELIGYDAVIPGNHDYDFGPEGWLHDRVQKDGEDEKGVIKGLQESAKDTFPLISANTYLLKSLQKNKNHKIDHVGCKVLEDGPAIDWKKAKRPSFLIPFHVEHVKVEGGEVKVALIGLDNSGTYKSTTSANVEDLCFREGRESYLEVRAELEKLPAKDRPDIYVIVMHDGDVTKSKTNPGSNKASTEELEGIVDVDPPLVDVVIAGHTHYTNNLKLGGKYNIPFIQSGSGGRLFGRVDLYWDAKKKQLNRDKTRQYAGIKMIPGQCDSDIFFCSGSNGKVFYDGAEVKEDEDVTKLIKQQRTDIAKAAADGKEVDGAKVVKLDQELGTVKSKLTIARYDESPLADMMADAMLEVSRKALEKHHLDSPNDSLAEVKQIDAALVNASGLRKAISEGTLVYESFYEVLPFNNRGVVIGPMTSKKIFETFKRNVQSCGAFGSLMQSGFKVTFTRDCDRDKVSAEQLAQLSDDEKKKAGNQLDEDAKLVSMVFTEADGKQVDIVKDGKLVSDREFMVATLDYIADGGDTIGFKDVPRALDLGVIREAIVSVWKEEKPTWPTKGMDATTGIDNRYKVIGP